MKTSTPPNPYLYDLATLHPHLPRRRTGQRGTLPARHRPARPRLLIGYLAQTLARDNAALRALCITGFCGGFTTFSTFSLDIVQRWQDGHYLVPTLYLILSLVGGIVAVLGGMALAR